MKNKMSVHFSSNTDLWSTPQEFFNTLNEEFHFTLDVAANHDNHKTDNYFTQEENGLEQSWDNEIVWCNPPYGRQIKNWVKKASEQLGGVCVMLIPSRTDTAWFHDYIYNKAEIRFIRGRLKFGGHKNSAPFPSIVVIFK